jgi:hypothetical protein
MRNGCTVRSPYVSSDRRGISQYCDPAWAFVYDPDQGTDYGLATNRMLVTAAKG